MHIDRNDRAARHQTLFREVNEQVVDLLQKGLAEANGDRGDVTILCECANADCTRQIELRTKVYEAVGESPVRFVIVPGHDWPDVERTVMEDEKYVVVEKFGKAAEIAAGLIDRSGDGKESSEAPGSPIGPHRQAAEDVHILTSAGDSMLRRVRSGDIGARLPLQVVVTFLAEARLASTVP
jgi:hypothetical protein